MVFSPTVVNPFRKPPRGAHTDARDDAKLSHVQHSSTCKHGPSRDQAGTRRCVPHLAQRHGPFARHFFFPGNSPHSRDIFHPRCDPQRASRPAFPRIASPRDIRERYVRVVSRRSFRASRLGRPTPTLPAGSTFFDPSRIIANSRCAFRQYRLLFPQTLATGRAGARPTFTTTTANHARARLAPSSTSPATAAATRSTSPSVADPSTSATTAGAKAPSKVSTIRRCDERRFHSSHAPM